MVEFSLLCVLILRRCPLLGRDYIPLLTRQLTFMLNFGVAMHVTELFSVLIPSYFCSNLIIEITSQVIHVLYLATCTTLERS